MAKWSEHRAPHGDAWSTLERRRESNSGMVRGPAHYAEPFAYSRTRQTHSSISDDEGSTPVPAAAMAIPRFRSCRPHSSSYDETSRRRVRTVSNNSIASTSSHSSFSSFGSSNPFDDCDEFTQFIAPRLPPAPYPVDPYHFYCRPPTPQSDTTSLIHQIRQVLLEGDIEHTLQPFKCKFKCVKYVQYSQVEFIIRIYTGGNGSLLLEFQRRRGSLLLWDGMYSMLYYRLVDWVDVSAPACSQSGAQKKVAPRDSLSVKVWQKLSTSVQTPTSGVEAMKIMITSQFLDAQREGCSGLAVITEDSESALIVARFGIVEYLVHAAASDDLEMARCAIGALGNISKAVSSFSDQGLAAHTLDQIKDAARVVVGRLGHTSDSLFSLELLRECARALGNFGKVCPTEVVVCEGTTRLQHHLNHRDQQLSTLCREALRELEANV